MTCGVSLPGKRPRQNSMPLFFHHGCSLCQEYYSIHIAAQLLSQGFLWLIIASQAVHFIIRLTVAVCQFVLFQFVDVCIA